MTQRNTRRTVAALFSLMACGSAMAAGTWGKPGLWEETPTHDGKKGEVTQSCYTADEVRIDDQKKEEEKVISQMADGCKMKNFKQSASALSFEYTCPDGKGSIKRAIESPTRNTTTWVYSGKPLTFKHEVSSRWVSADCGEHADQ